MNRRTFLQLIGLLYIAPLLRLPIPELEPERYDSSGGQWVFDGVNGLTFPAVAGAPLRQTPSATKMRKFRALTFLERLFGGNK